MYPGIDKSTVRFLKSQSKVKPQYAVPFQLLDMLYFFLMHTIYCSACSRPTYFTPKSSTTNENDMGRVPWVQRPCVCCVGWYPSLVRLRCNNSLARMPACGNPYIPFWIYMYTFPSCAKLSKSYLLIVS
jgi:hypothetical protein